MSPSSVCDDSALSANCSASEGCKAVGANSEGEGFYCDAGHQPITQTKNDKGGLEEGQRRTLT